MKLCFIFLFNRLIVDLLSVIPRLTRDPPAITENFKKSANALSLKNTRNVLIFALLQNVKKL